MPPELLRFYIFVFGLLIGSFLNVCIYRLPRDISISYPPSTCPNCREPIRPWQNIPLISYILLRGRCASCGIRISPRYPAIELLNGLLYLGVFHRFGFSAASSALMLMMSVFIVVTFIDLEFKIIPDEITIPGILLGLIIGPFLFGTGLVNSLIGLAVGGGSLIAAGLIGRIVLGKDSMGGGDIKFMAMIGAFFGWKAVIFTLFFGSLLGSVIGLGLMAARIIKKGEYVPFGPFLVAGVTLNIFYGRELTRWFTSLHPWL